MLTQIFIKDDSCQPEYTKIAAHSFGFQTDGYNPTGTSILYTGGNVNITLDYGLSTWSANVYDYGMVYIAGTLNSDMYSNGNAMGIALPINLVADDVVTISGDVYYNYAEAYINAGYDVNFVLGVYYFNCEDLKEKTAAPLYTFIPVSTTSFIGGETNKVCFAADVKLGSNFDIHDTRIVVGCNVFVTCPGTCEQVHADANVATVSYTLDIQRPCKAEIDNFIIRNCCEPIITELVHIPGLVVGDFHVDDEGNCWEVIEASTDVTNFTRNFTDTYASCVECQAANPCPLNLKISSCCVPGTEFVTGSLPGLNVGDTFVDNYGLCWTVDSETSGPISEESITVASIITGTCLTCKIENPCPNFYDVKSCCTSIYGVIAVPDVLNIGDSFVDAQGQCWNVGEAVEALPTIYGIEVVTVYPYQGDNVTPTACDLCKTANPCPTEYFITIRGCCDPERIEVAQIPAAYMIFNEGLIFNDWWGVCWEVMSFSTTGVETYPIWDWTGGLKPEFGQYKDCRDCTCANSNCKCKTFYEVRNCETDVISIFKMQPNLTIGQFYINQLDKVCYEVLGYGYPAFNESPVAFNPETQWPDFYTCDECTIGTPAYKVVELQPCCGEPNVNVGLYGPWVNGIGTTQAVVTHDNMTGAYTGTFCYTLVGLSTAPVSVIAWNTSSSYAFPDCPTCTQKYSCS